MTLSELITPARVIAEMQSDQHLPSIVELVDCLVETDALSAAQREPALTALKAREEQGSTGIGGGIAIPHSFLPDLDEVVAAFGRSTPGIEFGALDCAPVHFVVLFLVPKSQHGLHLKTLAAIAKLLNSAETRSLLSDATTENEIVEVFARRSPAA